MKNSKSLIISVTIGLLVGVLILYGLTINDPDFNNTTVDEVIVESEVIVDEAMLAVENPNQDAIDAVQLIKDIYSGDIEKILKNQALKSWGNDYEMVEYEYENQKEAYYKVHSVMYNKDLSGTINEILLGEAILNWITDFEMVWYEYENQLESWENMQ